MLLGDVSSNGLYTQIGILHDRRSRVTVCQLRTCAFAPLVPVISAAEKYESSEIARVFFIFRGSDERSGTCFCICSILLMPLSESHTAILSAILSVYPRP